MKLLVRSMDHDETDYVVEITDEEWAQMCAEADADIDCGSIDYDKLEKDWHIDFDDNRPHVDCLVSELESLNRLVVGY